MPTGTAIGQSGTSAFNPYIAQGIQTGGSLLGSIFSNIGARKRQREAFEHNIAMWERQLAYNHPAAQMERLKEAGLNPRLMYGPGGGPAASGQAKELPKYTAPEYKIDFGPMNLLSMLGQYHNIHGIQRRNSKTTQEVEALALNNLVNSATVQNRINEVKDRARRMKSQADRESALATISALERDLKSIVRKNSIDIEQRREELRRTSADANRIVIQNDINRVIRKFYKAGGISGAKDVAQILMMILQGGAKFGQ